MKSEELINSLIEMTKDHLNTVQYLNSLDDDFLTWKNESNSWNILECIEHLNYYGNFYLPEITSRMASSKHKSQARFKSGWLGNYFVQSMLPKDKLNKMKTFANMNPLGVQLSAETLDVFEKQLHQMLELLDAARSVCLTRTKTSISISKWIKLRLGDTLRVVIYHNERHLAQAKAIAERFEPASVAV